MQSLLPRVHNNASAKSDLIYCVYIYIGSGVKATCMHAKDHGTESVPTHEMPSRLIGMENTSITL